MKIIQIFFGEWRPTVVLASEVVVDVMQTLLGKYDVVLQTALDSIKVCFKFHFMM